MKVGSELGHSGRGLHSLAGSTYLLEMGPRPLEGTWHGVVSAALFARCSLRRASPLRRERDELRHLRLLDATARICGADDVEGRAVRPVTCRRQSLY